MSHNDDTYMKNKMLLHLHEQYAVNNNAKLSSAVTLIVGLLAVVGAYGYVFLHTSLTNGKSELLNSKAEFTLLSLILTATAATIVLGVLIYICMYQGFAQRKGQFIIYAIRCYHGFKIKNKDEERIFPDNYHPFDKKCIEAYQGLFGEFIKIFTAIQYIILISIIFLNFNCVHKDKLDDIFINVYYLVFAWCQVFLVRRDDKFSRKYKDLCHSYKYYKISQEIN